MDVDTLIIGGGPAGLTAACFSPAPALVLERLQAPARKLLATGGGRCNLTHATDAEGVIAAFGRRGRFMSPALRAFPPGAIRAFFAGLGVETRAEPDGCVFPVSQKASDVAQALERATRAAGAEIRCGVRVIRILVEQSHIERCECSSEPPESPVNLGNNRGIIENTLGHKQSHIERCDGSYGMKVVGVETAKGIIRARRVILAAGGQSYPELGSDGSGFGLAHGAGLAVTPPVPALAGLVTREEWPKNLAGIVLERGALRLDAPGAPKKWMAGPVLFTHKGLSGPPALDLSGEINARLARMSEAGDQKPAVPPCGSNALSCSSAALSAEGNPRASGDTAPERQNPVPPAVTVRLACVAGRTASDWRALFDGWRARHGGRALHNLLSSELPRALASALCGLTETRDTAAARAKKSALDALAAACAGQPLHVTGTEGWNRAMATRGGVALDELDPKTLACRRVSGLFCAGEVVDLDGRCGGYNLTWAFASGRLAGKGGV